MEIQTIPRRAINNNYLICYLCNSRFKNIYCSELKTFIRESNLCKSCIKSNASSTASRSKEYLSRVRSSKSNNYSEIIRTSNLLNLKKTQTFLKNIVIDCNEISSKFSNYYIETSLVELNPVFEKAIGASIDEVKIIYVSCLREIIQYNDITLQKHCDSKSIEWNNWCSDVVLYYICRKIIFGKEIPIK